MITMLWYFDLTGDGKPSSIGISNRTADRTSCDVTTLFTNPAIAASFAAHHHSELAKVASFQLLGRDVAEVVGFVAAENYRALVTGVSLLFALDPMPGEHVEMLSGTETLANLFGMAKEHKGASS